MVGRDRASCYQFVPRKLKGMSKRPFLERYLAGDRERVWHELRQLGASVREPAHLADATAVAREAMSRAKRNVATIIERLTGQGYRFGDPWNDDRAGQPLA